VQGPQALLPQQQIGAKIKQTARLQPQLYHLGEHVQGPPALLPQQQIGAQVDHCNHHLDNYPQQNYPQLYQQQDNP
jgi:hypothetical protein